MSKLTAKLVRAWFRHGVKNSPMKVYTDGKPILGQWYKSYPDECLCATGYPCPMQRHTSTLKNIRPDFGIYIHQIPVRSKFGCSQHCTLLAPTFHTKDVDGVSAREWLWMAVNDNVRDFGIKLLKEV